MKYCMIGGLDSLSLNTRVFMKAKSLATSHELRDLLMKTFLKLHISIISNLLSLCTTQRLLIVSLGAVGHSVQLK